MSIYVVDDKTITRVVELCAACNTKQGGLLGWVPPAIPVEWEGDSLRKAGRMLRAMNVDAVRTRYRDADETGMVPEEAFEMEDAEWRDRGGPTGNLWQALKSLDCYLYQCVDGDVYDRPLYKALEKMADAMRVAIIGEDERYRAAE